MCIREEIAQLHKAYILLKMTEFPLLQHNNGLLLLFCFFIQVAYLVLSSLTLENSLDMMFA